MSFIDYLRTYIKLPISLILKPDISKFNLIKKPYGFTKKGTFDLLSELVKKEIDQNNKEREDQLRGFPTWVEEMMNKSYKSSKEFLSFLKIYDDGFKKWEKEFLAPFKNGKFLNSIKKDTKKSLKEMLILEYNNYTITSKKQINDNDQAYEFSKIVSKTINKLEDTVSTYLKIYQKQTGTDPVIMKNIAEEFIKVLRYRSLSQYEVKVIQVKQERALIIDELFGLNKNKEHLLPVPI